MDRATIGVREILKQTRRQLVKALLCPASEEEQMALIAMRRSHQRFQDLMDRHNAGQLNASEHKELKTLVAGYEAMMLFNQSDLLTFAVSPCIM